MRGGGIQSSQCVRKGHRGSPYERGDMMNSLSLREEQ